MSSAESDDTQGGEGGAEQAVVPEAGAESEGFAPADALSAAEEAVAAPAAAPLALVTHGPALLAAHTCFFQLRIPLLASKEAMREAVLESLAHCHFWNE